MVGIEKYGNNRSIVYIYVLYEGLLNKITELMFKIRATAVCRLSENKNLRYR